MDRDSLFEVLTRKDIYRCGWCGSPVSFHGDILDKPDWEEQVDILKSDEEVNEILVNGACCPNGDE